MYNRMFTRRFEEMETNLITPFFSAIQSFSKSVISRELEVLELGDLRFVFKIEGDFTFVILSESTENLLFIYGSLEKIVESFLHGINNLGWDIEIVVQNPEFDKLIDVLIIGEDDVIQVKSQPGYFEIVEYISDLMLESDIMGAAILTGKGTVIYTSLSEEVLARSMRELEIRYQTKTFDLPQLFYVMQDGRKVCETIIQSEKFRELLLIVQFPSSTQLGMVDFHTENIVKKINSVF